MGSDKLCPMFEECGKIKTFWLFSMPDGRSRGQGLVEYTSPQDARSAISYLNGWSINGFTLKVQEDRAGSRSAGMETWQASQSSWTNKEVEVDWWDGRSIFFSGCPSQLPVGKVQAYFQEYGALESFHMFRHPSGKPRGIGVVKFVDPHAATQILASGMQIEGWQLFLREADSRGERAGGTTSSPNQSWSSYQEDWSSGTDVDPGKSIFFANVPFESREIDLKRRFAHAGVINSFQLFRRQDGSSRGMGIVEYVTTAAARRACNTLSETDIDGRYGRTQSELWGFGNATVGIPSAASGLQAAMQVCVKLRGQPNTCNHGQNERSSSEYDGCLDQPCAQTVGFALEEDGEKQQIISEPPEAKKCYMWCQSGTQQLVSKIEVDVDASIIALEDGAPLRARHDSPTLDDIEEYEIEEVIGPRNDDIHRVKMLARDDPHIEKLISQMTLEEKAGQLTILADTVRPCNPDINPEVNHRQAHEMVEQIKKSRVGSLFNGVGIKEGREAQRIAVEETRLGIPLIFGSDVIHGMWTVFPIPLGEAASFDPDLAERTARATALETTASGIHWTFAPMVDVARDQRWGRVAEGSGEDVFLGKQLGVARVRGFQGNDLRAEDSLLATPKHFAAYGGVSGGMDYNFVEISEASLRDIHLPAFKACIDAGALTLMSAFNDIAGVPASGNRWLCTEVLRNEWGFKGFIVSDYTADEELICHGFAADGRDAARLAFKAGVDMSMQSGLYVQHMQDLVAKGDVSMEEVDEGVRRILKIKKAIGLFENPYKCLDPKLEERVEKLRSEHEPLAREAGRKSIVLLKNEKKVLPLKKSGQKIALIGPFASDTQNLEGCWTVYGDKKRAVPVDSGIRQALSKADDLEIVQGCDFESAIDGGVDKAVAAAKKAEVVVLAIGEPENFSGESQSRTQIIIPPAQQALAEAVSATGTPVVVLLRTGRALALYGAVRDAQAILVTWFLGTQMGPAIADVLFGDYNPAGHLPVSFPADAGQQPLFYNAPRTGRPQGDGPRTFKASWREVASKALYPFGHGLSYTDFSFTKPSLSTDKLGWEQMLEVTAQVSNTGALAGEKVAQLYVHDCVASRVRPVRELKGFQKVLLKPGETKTLKFQLSRQDLSFHGSDGKLRAEPGEFHVWISGCSASGELAKFHLLAP
ncbi:bglX [Symbiodinium pilosum]|uniref:beta-glucosidase n=1 Tax=Symbiodinium pilosum TaxID=2952 RepID=A0A812IVE4_SYMPI|nr:bglX [Symbiodinium pilosum]